jgi:hypothetical protein
VELRDGNPTEDKLPILFLFGNSWGGVDEHDRLLLCQDLEKNGYLTKWKVLKMFYPSQKGIFSKLHHLQGRSSHILESGKLCYAYLLVMYRVFSTMFSYF